jgi:serine/threonine protein kinase
VDQQVAAPPVTAPKGLRQAGMQPIPGYRLIEPLGKGGFGEVWKCEVPGGLCKAVKFVPNQDESGSAANQERQALQLVKAIRHPFILSLERVEVVEGELVIVMELADKSLHGLLGDYQSRNLLGIPREEVLGYLLEAAEALDWMNFGHGLQHLDVKPHNLFLVSNHVKVADFGLVDRLTDMEKTHPTQRQNGGITPLYASPELLRGTVSRHCDQYSLAIVYQQLLTGTVPLWCQNLYQLMMLHMTAAPNLTPLPPEDRPIVARALSKRAEDRYPSCLDFLQALVCGEQGGKLDLPRRASAMKKIVSALCKPATSPPPPRKDNVVTPSLLDVPRAPSGACPTVPTVADNAEGQVSTPLLRVVSEARQALHAEGALPFSDLHSGGSSASAVTCVSVPGYRFLKCIGQTPLGDLWMAQDQQGRSCRALSLHNFVERDADLLKRLQGFRHPALPATEAIWSPEGRLVWIADDYEQTLRDRLEQCQKQGLPGIPREELFGHLRRAAEALDTLYQQYGLPHLGLNPRTLALRGERLFLMEYGLVPLIWLPTGQTGGNFNGRYAAPELFEKFDLTGIPEGEAARTALMGRADSTADQFSLALLYAEMLNGLPPQLPRPPVPPQRRPARRNHGDSGVALVGGKTRLDFDLLPTCDRLPLLKALHDDPQQRFSTCSAFVEALESSAVNATRRIYLYERLPAVIPFDSLQGETPEPDLVLPSVPEIVLNLSAPHRAASTQSQVVRGPFNFRYTRLDNDVWEFKFPLQIFRGALPLKVEGFRAEWRARTVEQNDESVLFHLDIPTPPRSGEREPAVPSYVAIDLKVQTTPNSSKYFAEAQVRVSPSAGRRERLVELLPELAPRLFDSLRRYLQANPEQRGEDRWPCPQALHVYPVQRDLELDEVLDGISRNISMGGVSFRVAQAPRAEQVYLHWYKAPITASYAVLARLIRVQPMAGGGFEVGGVFPS